MNFFGRAMGVPSDSSQQSSAVLHGAVLTWSRGLAARASARKRNMVPTVAQRAAFSRRASSNGQQPPQPNAGSTQKLRPLRGHLQQVLPPQPPC